MPQNDDIVGFYCCGMDESGEFYWLYFIFSFYMEWNLMYVCSFVLVQHALAVPVARPSQLQQLRVLPLRRS